MFSFNLYAMGITFKQFQTRPIFYKQVDAGFFPAWTYAVARNVSSSANALLDSIVYGTMVYFLAGFAYNDGASVGNFFIFLLLLYTSTFAFGVIFGCFSAGVRAFSTAKASVVFCKSTVTAVGTGVRHSCQSAPLITSLLRSIII